MTSAVRTPAVAGKFYPRRAEELRQAVQEYTSTEETGRIGAIGCIAPHAGYMYSGHVAGAVYSRLEIPNRVIILCPNHTGLGHPLAIMTRTAWQTPLGEVAADAELGTALLRRFPSLHEDGTAHRSEHAIEVHPNATAILLDFLETAGCTSATLRLASGKDGPVITESGFFIMDASFDAIRDGLHAELKQLPGVLETGLFEGYDFEIVEGPYSRAQAT